MARLKSFLEFLVEDGNENLPGRWPYAVARSGVDSVAINNPIRLQQINSDLAKVTRRDFLTPAIAIEKIRQVLSQLYALHFPQMVIQDKEQGVVVFEIGQFGKLTGFNIDGTDLSHDRANSLDLYLYFEYAMTDSGYYKVVAAKLVDQGDLQELLDQENSETAPEDEAEKTSEVPKQNENPWLDEESINEARTEATKYNVHGKRVAHGREQMGKETLDVIHHHKRELANAKKQGDLARVRKHAGEVKNWEAQLSHIRGKKSSIAYNPEKKTRTPIKKKVLTPADAAANVLKPADVAARLKARLHKEEPLDELSRKTLGSYIRGAQHSSVKAGKDSEYAFQRLWANDKYANQNHKKLEKLSDTSAKKLQNRQVGTERATKRLEKEEPLDESLPASASAKDYIEDFAKSKNSRFSGDSKKERIRRALGAFYNHKRK